VVSDSKWNGRKRDAWNEHDVHVAVGKVPKYLGRNIDTREPDIWSTGLPEMSEIANVINGPLARKHAYYQQYNARSVHQGYQPFFRKNCVLTDS